MERDAALECIILTQGSSARYTALHQDIPIGDEEMGAFTDVSVLVCVDP